jgi:arylsulfatase A-like enzyme
VDNVTQLPLATVTPGQALKSAGYATGYFGKWHLGQQGQYHPSRRGFDEAITSMGQHFDFATQPKVDYPPGTYLADFLTDKATDFIRRHKDGPFFLCLTHFGVHSPHQAKKEWIAKFKDKPAAGGHRDPVYAAMIASVDESVGRVLALLDELKLSEHTLVIFTSDNGGVGGYARAGVQRNPGITDNDPLRGGKGMLYEGGVRVPYLFRWPGTVPPGTTCDTPINSVDLFPTLLELAGAKPPGDQPLDGASYVGLLKSGGRAKLDRDAVYWHFPGYLGAGQGGWRTTPAGAVRRGDWKLLEFFEDNRVELYNLADDLGERRDQAAARPELTRELRQQLHAWRAAVKAPLPTPNPDYRK